MRAGAALTAGAHHAADLIRDLPGAVSGVEGSGAVHDACGAELARATLGGEELLASAQRMERAIAQYAATLGMVRIVAKWAVEQRAWSEQLFVAAQRASPHTKAGDLALAKQAREVAEELARTAVNAVEQAVILVTTELARVTSELRSTIASAGARTATAKARLMESSNFFGETSPGVSVVYYDDSAAPSVEARIEQAASIWNNRLNNVKLVEAYPGSPRPTVFYHEEKGEMGSRHDVDTTTKDSTVSKITFSLGDVPPGHLRTVTHETGHALGLPDNYGAPCEVLMSGGRAAGSGDGNPECESYLPTTAEVNQVDQLWQPGAERGSNGVPIGILKRWEQPWDGLPVVTMEEEMQVVPNR
ncbi:MAG: snapalysin family zinc-dependent metalloprotease [Nocardioides sp.]